MKTSSYTAKLLLLVFVLPLILMSFGLWQFSRAPSEERNAAEISKIDEIIESIKEEQAKKSTPLMIKGDDGKMYSAAVVIHSLYQDQEELRGGLFGIFYEPLSVAGSVLGFLAAIIGGIGLLFIKKMGRNAMKSRDDLLRSFVSGRKLLPWLLIGTGTFTLFSIGVAATFELMNFVSTHDMSGRGSVKLILAGVILIIGVFVVAVQLIISIFKASRQVFENGPLTLMGRCTNEEEAPALWSFVRGVADKAKATLPSNIVIGLDECFFVTESPVALRNGDPVPPGRTLYLPLPYLAFMGRDEAAAVIGHELAHFQGADTEYSLKFSPIYASAVNNLSAVHAIGDGSQNYVGWMFKPTLMLGEFFLHSFHSAVQHWSRQRELAADAVGAAVTDGRSIALSLLRINVLSARIGESLVESWNKAGKVQGGILKKIILDVKSQELPDPRACLEKEQPHPTDSHPTTGQRLSALGVAVDAALLAEASNTAGSSLLQELGLYEAADLGTSEDAASAKTATSSLGQTLEAEFTQAADESVAKEIETLREFSDAGREAVSLYEGSKFFIFLFVLLGIGSFSGAISIIMNTDFSDPRIHLYEVYQILGAIAAVGLLLFYGAFAFWRRRKTPVAMFTEQGILFSNLTTPVPWTVVEDYSINVHTYNGATTSTALIIDLASDYVMPPYRKTKRAKYMPKKNQISLNAPTFRMDAEKLGPLFATYWRGGMARARLAELGAL